MTSSTTNSPENEPKRRSGNESLAELQPAKIEVAPSRVLIISIPRSGGTSLAQALGSYFSYPVANEPFHPSMASTPFSLQEKMIVKVIIGCPNASFFENFKSLEQYFEQLDHFCSLFDRTILLSRGCLDDATRSYFSARERERNLETEPLASHSEAVARAWHGSYTASSGIPDPAIIEEMRGFDDTLRAFARHSGRPLVMYEDIYAREIEHFTATLESLDLCVDPDALRPLLDPAHRYLKT